MFFGRSSKYLELPVTAHDPVFIISVTEIW